MRAAAETLVRSHGAHSVLIKGGHLVGAAHDVLLHEGTFTVFSHDRIESRNTHGTGCTLSSAVAAQLANGVDLHESVGIALDYVHEAIRTAPGLGKGHGPVNHLA